METEPDNMVVTQLFLWVNGSRLDAMQEADVCFGAFELPICIARSRWLPEHQPH